MAYNNTKVKERQAIASTSQTEPLGIVSEVPMNEWSANISYEKLNIVTHKYSTFIAKRANKDIEPLVADGWKNVWMQLLSGVGIFSTVVEYASGDASSSTPPQEGWGPELPMFQAGQLLWTRLTITYTDNTSAVFYSVGVTVAPTKTSELINDGNGTSPFATEAFTNSSILGDECDCLIYFNNTDPASVYGGTWMELTAGTFLRAGGTGGTTKSEIATDGGSNSHNHVVGAQDDTSAYAIMDTGIAYADGTSQRGVLTRTIKVKGYSSDLFMFIDNQAATFREQTNALDRVVQVVGSTKPASTEPIYKNCHIWRKIIL